MDQKPRTDLDRVPAEMAAAREEFQKTLQAMKAPARGLAFGLMLGVALYAFDVATWKLVALCVVVTVFCALDIARQRLEQVAVIAFGITALLWLQIPTVNRLLAGADKVLDWLGV